MTLTPVTLHLWCQKWDLSIQCCSDGTVQIQSMVMVMVQLQKDEKARYRGTLRTLVMYRSSDTNPKLIDERYSYFFLMN